MQPLNPTVVFRHKKENLRKCSLRGLEDRSDFRFIPYPVQNPLPNLSNYIVLTLGAPPLQPEDAEHGLLLIDATWRYASQMLSKLSPMLDALPKRSLPSHYRTAYPRRQEDCPNPDEGLASIEALYLAYCILGYSCDGLLNHYYWKEPFLQKNNL